MAATRPQRAAVLAALVLLGAVGPLATPGQALPGGTLTVRAYIDGRSELRVQGGDLWWHHYDYAAPGRHNFNNFPTYLDGYAWYPSWLFSGEGRSCNCDSSRFLLASLGLSFDGQPVTVTVHEARGSVGVTQPDAANGYLLGIMLNDNPQGGPAWYQFSIAFHAASCDVHINRDHQVRSASNLLNPGAAGTAEDPLRLGRCRAAGQPVGLSVRNTSLHIELVELDLEENAVGAELVNVTNLVVRASRFASNVVGLSVAGSSVVAVRATDFLGNVRAAVDASDLDQVDARGNYWGGPSGPPPLGLGQANAVAPGVAVDRWRSETALALPPGGIGVTVEAVAGAEGWLRSHASVTPEAVGLPAGTSLYARLDGGSCTPVTGTLQVAGEGNHTLQVGTDPACQAMGRLLNFSIDTVAPLVGLLPVGNLTNLLREVLNGTLRLALGLDVCVGKAAVLASDLTSKVAQSFFDLEVGLPPLLDKVVDPVLGDLFCAARPNQTGTQGAWAWAVDRAGNPGPCCNTTPPEPGPIPGPIPLPPWPGYPRVPAPGWPPTRLCVDTQPPFTQLDVGSPRYPPEGLHPGWVHPRTPFVLHAADPGGECAAGLNVTLWSYDNGEERRYDGGELRLALPDGPHVLGYRSTDKVNNAEATKSFPARWDGTAPAVRFAQPEPGTVSLNGHYLNHTRQLAPDGLPLTVVGGKIRVVPEAHDHAAGLEGVGVASVALLLDGREVARSAGGPLEVDLWNEMGLILGNHTLTLVAEDHLRNADHTNLTVFVVPVPTVTERPGPLPAGWRQRLLLDREVEVPATGTGQEVLLLDGEANASNPAWYDLRVQLGGQALPLLTLPVGAVLPPLHAAHRVAIGPAAVNVTVLHRYDPSQAACPPAGPAPCLPLAAPAAGEAPWALGPGMHADFVVEARVAVAGEPLATRVLRLPLAGQMLALAP